MAGRRTGTPAEQDTRQRRSHAGATRLIALAVPGISALLAGELRSMTGVTVQDTGSDGRADVVLCTADASALSQVLTSRLAEDIFVEAGRTQRSEGDRPAWIAGRLWRPTRVRQALAARAGLARPAGNPTTFRVIVRVLQERSFRRTDLRRQLTDTIQRRQPTWQFADPADVEVWAVEYQPGKIVAGVRVSDRRMRQHNGRDIERSGALRPTVAAAMIQLAGAPVGSLLDPCCGSGTILAAAAEAGWHAEGIDIDPEAVRIARTNAPGLAVRTGDVRHLPLDDSSVLACVANLPFGKQYVLQQAMPDWLRAALSELARVTRRGGRIVILVPAVPADAVPGTLALVHRIPIRLLGVRTTIWAYDRR